MGWHHHFSHLLDFPYKRWIVNTLIYLYTIIVYTQITLTTLIINHPNIPFFQLSLSLSHSLSLTVERRIDEWFCTPHCHCVSECVSVHYVKNFLSIVDCLLSSVHLLALLFTIFIVIPHLFSAILIFFSFVCSLPGMFACFCFMALLCVRVREWFSILYLYTAFLDVLKKGQYD